MGEPPKGFHNFKDRLESTGMSESEKALIVSRLRENEKSRCNSKRVRNYG